ncbi:MAG: sugar phosphate isomerase/epimerase [Chloroflexi bacterium]|nr:sugar phosphate isomerase/epimerase [Chloroflexota bacterium]MCL5108682.1 sugar phosphate isomerase/epimerase [Chloroflexota bacterium]
MRLACSSYSFPLLTLEQSAQLAAMLGFRFLDLGTQPGKTVCLAPAEVEADPGGVADRLLRIAELWGLGYPDLFTVLAEPLNSPSLAARQANGERFAAHLRLCRQAGIAGLTLMPGPLWPDLGYERSLRFCAEELSRLLAWAGEADVRLSIEAHAESIVEDPERALELLQRVPGLKLTLDYAHFVYLGVPTARVHELLPYAAHCHARQAARGQMQAIWQEGEIDFEDVVGRLAARGYRGFVSLEYVWAERWGNNRLDTLSETILLRDRLLRSPHVEL